MMGNFPGKYELEVIGGTTGSSCEREGKTGNIYVFSPGTYWFMVSSKDGGIHPLLPMISPSRKFVKQRQEMVFLELEFHRKMVLKLSRAGMEDLLM